LVADVLDHIARHDGGELIRPERQSLSAGAGKGDLVETGSLKLLPRDDQPPHRNVNAAEPLDLMTHRREERAAAASQVENRSRTLIRADRFQPVRHAAGGGEDMANLARFQLEGDVAG
jgi:hypothetical protein